MNSGKAYRDRLIKLLARGPKRPSELSVRARLRALGRTGGELIEDNLTDRAAILTYYGIMAIFPGLLVLVASASVLGGPTARSVARGIESMTFGPSQNIIAESIANLQQNRREAGIVAIIGLVIAFYSASGYVGAFMRAANAIYDVPEGRPVWKTLPLRFLITVVTGLFLALSALGIVFTGRLATEIGQLLNIDPERIRIFEIFKWPFLVVAFGLLLAVLYWAAPNARQGGFRWITPGSILATLVWVAVSGGFAFYIARFDSFDRTYGALGGVVVFLVWLWLTNVAVLLGAEFDAELARERAIAAGLPPRTEPYLPLRDLPKEVEEESDI
ncbi:MAG TPA: YihY/virulence factor BrkB family protein [Micromonosporaceae bacterium]|nr:YihY/virulence factor BrkB family protein [Micromonosporaceae bacterium]HCU48353.1 YihY/virulence factor BrkB family protein [Micromonosporaceae bacterium]